jgi:hypothetical protein
MATERQRRMVGQRMHQCERAVLMALLYERSSGHCEYPGGCEESDIKKLTMDHFTPRAVANIWKWTPDQTNDLSNLLLLCHEHHDKKDKNTPLIAEENRIEFAAFKPFLLEQMAKEKARRQEKEIEELKIELVA